MLLPNVKLVFDISISFLLPQFFIIMMKWVVAQVIGVTVVMVYSNSVSELYAQCQRMYAVALKILHWSTFLFGRLVSPLTLAPLLLCRWHSCCMMPLRTLW